MIAVEALSRSILFSPARVSSSNSLQRTDTPPTEPDHVRPELYPLSLGRLMSVSPGLYIAYGAVLAVTRLHKSAIEPRG